VKTVRAAVIGAGNMGRHHVRILNSLQGVDVVAVVDRDIGRAETIARPFGHAVLDDIELLPEIDVAVVATPTESHLPVASALLRRGVSVMVEKPLALTVEEGEQLVCIAREEGVILAVGHVERFNPVVRFLLSIELKPAFIQFERMSPFTPRITSNVISDLMVHDLDLACALAGGEPARLEAMAQSVFTDTPDIASALLEFPNNTVVSVTASRATQDKVRRIAITESERYIVADCLRQDISVKRETTVEYPASEPGLYRQANVVEIPYLDRSGEPLAREVEDFIDAFRSRSRPTVDGEDGLRALKLVAAVEAAVGV